MVHALTSTSLFALVPEVDVNQKSSLGPKHTNANTYIVVLSENSKATNTQGVYYYVYFDSL
jgi:hypothetical protein